MSKKDDDFFRDWESEVFGFGYGTGEAYLIPELRRFLLNTQYSGVYDYRDLEEVMPPAIVWLLINILCKADIIEYGTSPRFGWLTKQGIRLRDSMADKNMDELLNVLDCSPEVSLDICGSDYCNCDKRCVNPFIKAKLERWHRDNHE